MTTIDLTALYQVDDDDLTRLHARLAAGAEHDGLLDVAYRTVDSPVGSLLIAATPVGLVRVAFSNEGHDAVLQNLSDRISSRLLHAPAHPPATDRPHHPIRRTAHQCRAEDGFGESFPRLFDQDGTH